MAFFKTVDLRGLSFFSALEQASKAFGDINKNGILEILLDKKKNFTDDLKKWALSRGYQTSDIDADNRMTRLFIQKNGSKARK